jgi:glycosyltransferase involved in cell wall biosynthesis
MIDSSRIAVVIPAYKVSDTIEEVVQALPDIVDYIIVVDDKCPHYSGEKTEKIDRKNIIALYHETNQGVGGAVITGYKKALELGCDIVIKIDGDGQMDPKYINNIIKPLVENEADYAKGNRFQDFEALKSMPKIRLFGNSALSFFVKLSSGYWNIIDPTNGYTAIHKRVLHEIDLRKISKRYFFESDMLVHLNIVNAVAKDINIPARYGNEKSSLDIKKIIVQFPPKLLKGLIKRVFLKYFIYDFNMASVYILIGLPVFSLSVLWGIVEWIDSIVSGVPRTAGTIMLAALPIILSFQMLLQAINIDIYSVPKKK